MLADRAMVRSLGWVQSRVLASALTSTSSGSSDFGMHLVAPTMIRHCGARDRDRVEQHGREGSGGHKGRAVAWHERLCLPKVYRGQRARRAEHRGHGLLGSVGGLL